jgi:hypothetical protein
MGGIDVSDEQREHRGRIPGSRADLEDPMPWLQLGASSITANVYDPRTC